MYNRKYFRERGLNSETKEKLFDFLIKNLVITKEEIEIIINYLEKREKQVKEKDYFGFVYDITQFCNLNCLHCSVDAKPIFINSEKINFETTYEEVCTIIDQIYKYLEENKIERYFFMFGGGEPFIRPDFCNILIYASKKFGATNVGVNTNGTLLDIEILFRLRKYIGFLEISIDGFEKQHNAWRDPNKITNIPNPFKKSISLIEKIYEEPSILEILEVSSIATSDNISILPDFVNYLYNKGIKNYSIHRAIPIGRMSKLLSKVPSTQQYIKLLIKLGKLMKNNREIKAHIHHSLESIYSALFLGRDIHESDIIMRSGRHSIGIRWDGKIFFDAWCVVPPYDLLCCGNILDENISLNKIIMSENNPINITSKIVNKNLRCKSCKFQCSGGMRINAQIHYINKYCNSNVSCNDLICGLSQIDPACPLYE